MKRLLSLALACLCITLLLASCGGGARVEIDDYEWYMRYALIKSETSYAFVAMAEEMGGAYENCAVVDVRLVAKNGELTLVDFTNDKTYTGTYRLSERLEDGSIEYAITLGNSAGEAATALTAADGNGNEPTLPILVGDYMLCFFAK